MKDHGVKPGMNGANVYAAINADGPNKVGARDTEAGGTWGTIADKWNHQMHTAPRPDACSTRQPPRRVQSAEQQVTLRQALALGPAGFRSLGRVRPI